MSVSVRRFTATDFAPALELCRGAGWTQLARDWRRLVEYEPDGCFVAEIDGHLVGTVTSTRYGNELAWIGMMLVHTDYRRRGIASRLMETCLEYLRGNDVDCIKLDATPAGRPVYEKLGFQSEWTFRRWSRGTDDTSLKDAHSTNSISLANLRRDLVAFGVDRSAMLRRLAEGSHVMNIDEGYGVRRPCYRGSHLGPIVAEHPDAAAKIASELLDVSPHNAFWDIPDRNQDGIRLAESFGFTPVRDLTRMWLGSNSVQPALDLQYAIADPGTG